MKKFNLFLIGALLCVIGLTSCLEGGNTTQGYALGVLDYSYSYTTPVMKTSYGNYYGPELTSMISSGNLEIGNCYYFQYTIDFDLPENSQEMVQTNGYYTVSVYPIAEAEKYYPNYYLTDTSAVLPNELPVSDIVSEDGPYGYAEDYLFITHVVNHLKDLDLHWDMSYNDGDDMITEESGKRHYNLFVRATASGDKDENKVTAEHLHFNAYYLRNFFESAARKEKDRLGSSYNTSSTFTVKFNYVSEISDDSKITWKSESVDNLYIAWFVPE
jgi:hypothetical protein